MEAINSAHLACCDSPLPALQTRTPTWLERSSDSEWAEPLRWCHRLTARGQKTHCAFMKVEKMLEAEEEKEAEEEDLAEEAEE